MAVTCVALSASDGTVLRTDVEGKSANERCVCALQSLASLMACSGVDGMTAVAVTPLSPCKRCSGVSHWLWRP